MPLLRGTMVIINDAFDAALLEECITECLMYRRDHGNRVRPDRLFVLQSELHMVAATGSRRAAQLVATPQPAQGAASGTMDVVTASQILNKSGQMIRRYCADGTLAAVKRQQAWLIDVRSIEAFQADREQSASA